MSRGLTGNRPPWDVDPGLAARDSGTVHLVMHAHREICEMHLLKPDGHIGIGGGEPEIALIYGRRVSIRFL